MDNTAWVAKHFKDKIINQPDIKLRKLQDLIRIKYGVYVGKSICVRAKHQVMGQYLGDYKQEFARIYDYADMLRSTNPGSTVVVKTSKEKIPSKEVFVGIYICLHAFKVGWLEGCRNFIGFDGAFLKGVCKSEILSCIGKNGNNQMYYVAWAVVEKETKHTWSWFFRCLIHDLQLTESQGEGLTIISDMQKTHVEQLETKVERRGKKKKFWARARASFEEYLKAKIDELAELGDSKIIEDLLRYPKQCWCRAFFKDWSKCDSVENNMCETFNSWILSARHKSIITMLEEIKVKVIERMITMREFATRCISDVSLMAMGYIEEAVKHEFKWNGDTGYEIQHGIYKHIVDFSNNTCTCRSWQLKGIPCSHAICAMFFKRFEPANYVTHWYRKETYLKAFSCYIQPVTNMEMRPSTQNPTVEPPIITKMPGRPKKNKKIAQDEPKKKWAPDYRNSNFIPLFSRWAPDCLNLNCFPFPGTLCCLPLFSRWAPDCQNLNFFLLNLELFSSVLELVSLVLQVGARLLELRTAFPCNLSYFPLFSRWAPDCLNLNCFLLRLLLL
ncbi:PREDICTED: uncharacterized protein LOC109220453 [Nicotiana attenuata]|uniref:uncharacterized protein LOC109220453 n=1 Tax=Nicotiana attenuata TaxID=49451 RepID=UPI00090504CE|nr:PREDICTED: uncharacterized protein LOC109220453 [Nicotiana attenuata]